MEKKQAVQRWKDNEFTLSIAFVLAKLIAKGEITTAVDLRGITIGNEGPIKDLWYANLAGCVLSGIDFRYSRFEGSFKDAAIDRCRFDESLFEACGMLSARFVNCRFDKSVFRLISMDDGYFEDCSFNAAKFTGKTMMEYGARRAKFVGCDFSQASFSRLEYRACQFVDCDFSGAKFDKSVFASVKFFGTAPAADQFHACDFSRIFLNDEEIAGFATR